MKIYIIKLCTLLAVALFAFTSCDTDAEGTKYNNDGANVAFASTQMIVEITTADNGKIKVPVYRGYAADNLSVQLELDDATVEDEIFSLPNSTVTFNAGENIAYAELNFDIDDLGVTDTYKMTLTVKDKSLLSPSDWGQLALTAKRKLTWGNYGTGVYISGLFDQSWAQPIEKAAEGNIFRLPDCIYEGYPFIFALSDDGQSLVSWDRQASGYKDEDYGMLYFDATSMTRSGNTLTFGMRGLVIYNGGWGLLIPAFTEKLELPTN